MSSDVNCIEFESVLVQVRGIYKNSVQCDMREYNEDTIAIVHVQKARGKQDHDIVKRRDEDYEGEEEALVRRQGGCQEIGQKDSC